MTITEARAYARIARTIYVRVRLHAGKGAPKTWFRAHKSDVLLMLQGHERDARVHGMWSESGQSLYLGKI